jgi:EAL domain-containing protein (putative c-di-GMP-specific phosphodiesterase class I)
MNFDTIKVDKTFVRDIHSDTYSRSFIKLISDLSKELGISLCVEGVETKKQLHMLKEMDVELLQGYYFGKPMPVEKFERKFLKKVKR